LPAGRPSRRAVSASGKEGGTWGKHGFPRDQAERAGFEPATHLSAGTRFPVALLRPLGHLSRAARLRHKSVEAPGRVPGRGRRPALPAGRPGKRQSRRCGKKNPGKCKHFPGQKFAEPEALSSTSRANFPLPRTAAPRGFVLLALRARRRRQSMRPDRSRQGCGKQKFAQFAHLLIAAQDLHGLYAYACQPDRGGRAVKVTIIGAGNMGLGSARGPSRAGTRSR
jgi:hypothetical protein